MECKDSEVTCSERACLSKHNLLRFPFIVSRQANILLPLDGKALPVIIINLTMGSKPVEAQYFKKPTTLVAGGKDTPKEKTMDKIRF